MSGRLPGKTALITGAGQGIGRAAAIAFAAEGAEVWATDRDGASVATIDGCIGREMDVLDPAAIDAVVREAGPLDVLFNCAGHVASGTVLDCTEADWPLTVTANSLAAGGVRLKLLSTKFHEETGAGSGCLRFTYSNSSRVGETMRKAE